MHFALSLAGLGAFLMASFSVISASATPPLLVSHLRSEDTDLPQLVDTSTPRFSWRLESSDRGVTQSAYQLRLAALDAHGAVASDLIETPIIASDQSQWVPLAGFRARAQTRYQWQVKVWDNQDQSSDWSDPAVFETSLLDRPWCAAWITDGRPVANGTAPPARYLRKSFELSAAPVRAKLYLSAFGLAEPWLNGRKVTEDYFLPGWPDYRKRNFYVSYDVTAHIVAGDNTFGIVLGDGWFSGTLFLDH
jgi:alpha-L-rhamnosidase